jgi:hypothetical protein
MSIHALNPWTELVKLHPDVESGSLAEAVFAIDLGAIATGDPSTPKGWQRRHCGVMSEPDNSQNRSVAILPRNPGRSGGGRDDGSARSTFLKTGYQPIRSAPFRKLAVLSTPAEAGLGHHGQPRLHWCKGRREQLHARTFPDLLINVSSCY